MITKPEVEESPSGARRAAESAVTTQQAAGRSLRYAGRMSFRGIQLLFSGCLTSLFYAGFLAAGTFTGQIKALALTAAVGIAFLIYFRWSWRRA